MAFHPSGDELAGIVDLFGGLTRDELGKACAELAFKQGGDQEPASFDESIREAVESYSLLAVEHEGDLLLTPGPTAFPSLPDGAMDLPHILDADERTIPPTTLADRVRERLEADANTALEADDHERLRYLHEVSYDAEAWAPVTLEGVRAQLDDEL